MGCGAVGPRGLSANHAMAAAQSAAATRFTGWVMATVAKGRAAHSSAIEMVAPTTRPPANDNGANSSAGSPSPISTPAAIASAVNNIVGATSGAISRLASGATSDSDAKW